MKYAYWRIKMKVKFLVIMVFAVMAYGQSEPVSIDLSEFTTIFSSSTEQVEIHWETGEEVDVSHFSVWRSTSPANAGTKVIDFVLATGGASGDIYDEIDTPTSSGRYYYSLEEVDLGGNSVFLQPTSTDKFVDVILASDPVSDTESISGNGWYNFNEGGSGGDAPGDGHQVRVEIMDGSSGTMTVTQTNQAPANAPGADVAPYQWDFSGTIFSQVRIYFYYNPADVSGFAENSDFIGIAQYNPNSKTWNWRGGSVDAVNHRVSVQGVYPTGKFALYRRIFGDANGDGYVDAQDLQRFGDAWHATSSGEFTNGSYSRFFNYNKSENSGNQIIDAVDLQVFGDCWHNGGEY